MKQTAIVRSEKLKQFTVLQRKPIVRLNEISYFVKLIIG